MKTPEFTKASFDAAVAKIEQLYDIEIVIEPEVPERSLAIDEFIDEIFDAEKDPADQLPKIVAFRKVHPDEVELVILEVMMRAMMGDQETALATAESAAEYWLDDLSLTTTIISLQPSPEATVANAFRLGNPPDIKMLLGKLAGKRYSLAEYVNFEDAALLIAIASGQEDEIFRRGELLLALGLEVDMVYERIDHYFNLLSQKNVENGRIMPGSWEGPPNKADTPLASAAIGELWDGFMEEFANEVSDFLSFSGMAGGPVADDLPQSIRPKRSKNAATEVYQIKVTLRSIRPPIWRRLLVTSDTELAEIHGIIQDTFGWYNCHLHQFLDGRESYAPPSPYEDYSEDYTGMTIGDFLNRPKQKIIYEYDFGDSWEHEILLEKVLPVEKDKSYPICIKGKRHRPPEDVGGPWGYEYFLEVLKDPKHEEYEELTEWAGGDFDPEEFDLEAINRRLIS